MMHWCPYALLRLVFAEHGEQCLGLHRRALRYQRQALRRWEPDIVLVLPIVEEEGTNLSRLFEITTFATSPLRMFRERLVNV
jgi:hypothetical protein